VTTNIVTRHTSNNSRGYLVPDTSTEQYQRSFFGQSGVDWNELEEKVVQAGSVAAFSAAIGRGALPTSLH
jgi:translation initiation factor 6 (eIF-6)